VKGDKYDGLVNFLNDNPSLPSCIDKDIDHLSRLPSQNILKNLSPTLNHVKSHHLSSDLDSLGYLKTEQQQPDQENNNIQFEDLRVKKGGKSVPKQRQTGEKAPMRSLARKGTLEGQEHLSPLKPMSDNRIRNDIDTDSVMDDILGALTGRKDNMESSRALHKPETKLFDGNIIIMT